MSAKHACQAYNEPNARKPGALQFPAFKTNEVETPHAHQFHLLFAYLVKTSHKQKGNQDAKASGIRRKSRRRQTQQARCAAATAVADTAAGATPADTAT